MFCTFVRILGSNLDLRGINAFNTSSFGICLLNTLSFSSKPAKNKGICYFMIPSMQWNQIYVAQGSRRSRQASRKVLEVPWSIQTVVILKDFDAPLEVVVPVCPEAEVYPTTFSDTIFVTIYGSVKANANFPGSSRKRVVGFRLG